MTNSEISIKIVDTLLSVNETDWDACAAPEAVDEARPLDPFTTYRFCELLKKVVPWVMRLVGTLITSSLFVEISC